MSDIEITFAASLKLTSPHLAPSRDSNLDVVSLHSAAIF